MHLLLGQTIDAIDGPFGTITDIILDADNWAVAHIIAQPFGNYPTAILVPICLLDTAAGIPKITLTAQYALRLQMVPLDRLVSLAAGPAFAPWAGSQPASVACQTSGSATGRPARAIDGTTVGEVCGFRINKRCLDAALVRLSYDETCIVEVPMIDVDVIGTRSIDLYMTATRLRQLPPLNVAELRSERQRTYEREIVFAARRTSLPLRPQAWHRTTPQC